ncbi:NAD(P)H-hydrate dehydratase [Desulfovibrio sulfodismutans]|uniref:Bifunctional NAD(P)H-hydrate repair enzyme n=2 Tax=Desulfolutivibrio sulfodismutans TaxID=63561 RepID=A0A7K3NGE0_9BACT|nr:NAD(P)H-hydrate dehydratase [Desulfolutivibrio sulfodismutans]NDY55147.1 NAD(P)H-hydrate dehydratase [Desulfolutivibrio sulfodismutans]QLA14432.1 NAD(P)H-hydrate dehydratase [Desulfolutivibrio sulfodismutans DSM 3696]
MAAWDAAAMQDFGFHPHVLMENASRAAFAVLEKEYGPLAGARVHLYAGPGQNGGDALALARLLAAAGAKPLTLLARPRSRFRKSAAYNLRLAEKLGLPIRPLSRAGRSMDERPDILVDGLLGTGFRGPLSPDFAAFVAKINAASGKSLIFSLDIPSGLDGLTGRPGPDAVRATATATFEAAKAGLFLPHARPFTGRLHVCPIGIPAQIKAAHPASFAGIAPGIMDHVPAASPLMHKGTAGKVLVGGGSPGLCGAPLLCAMGAMRAGAGLVTVACPAGIEPAVKAGRPEIMTAPLPETSPGAGWSADMAEAVRDMATAADAVVIGPGLGRGDGGEAFLAGLFSPGPLSVPLVLDADALFFLADVPDLAARLGPRAVLTPHPGEMARLLRLSVAEVEADRPGAARTLAARTGAVVVLKGPGTVIVDGSHAGSPVILSPHAAPNLAVGGSGDVLAGVVARLLAAGRSPLLAACLGVYWHGLCGERLSRRFPRRGNTAVDIADALPRVFRHPQP